VGMDLVDPTIDFVKLAASLGIAAERTRTVGDTIDVIASGLQAATPMLIDVEIDRSFKPL
jgi:benzoylformate decarboxylase